MFFLQKPFSPVRVVFWAQATLAAGLLSAGFLPGYAGAAWKEAWAEVVLGAREFLSDGRLPPSIRPPPNPVGMEPRASGAGESLTSPPGPPPDTPPTRRQRMRSAPWPDQASLPTWPPRAKVSGATNNADPTKLYSRTSTKALLDQPAGIQFLLSCEECGTTNRFTKNETLMEFGWIAYHCRECRKPLLFHVRAQSGRLHELPILQSLEASVLWTPRGSSSEQLSWSLKLDRRRMQEGAYAEFFCHGCARWQWSNVAGYHLLDVSCSNLACQRLITSIVSDETGRRRSLSGYLAGFNPDPSERQVVAIWLRHLARFRYDHNRRRAPVHDWQNPATTWQTGAGVCRDSAALLAGWLQSAGHDARMTTGLLLSPTNPGGGEPHAWVVLVDRATRKQYLLETAGETQESRMRTPPLAIHKAMEYAAQYQYLPDGCLSLGDRPIAPGEYVEGWHFSPDPLGP